MLLAGLFIAYQLNSDFSPGNDSKPATFLPVAVLEYGALSFSPEEAPFMFEWESTGPEGIKPARVPDIDAKLPGGQTARENLRAGRLRVVKEKYFIEPSVVPGRYVSIFGLGSGLTALPVFAVGKLLNGSLVKNRPMVWGLAKVAASLCVAGSAALLFLIAVRFMSSRRALLLALVYGLGTCVWSISSQALWQHGPNELFLMFSAYWLVRAQSESRSYFFVGLSLAAAVTCRPTSIVVAALVTAMALIQSPKLAWRVLVGAAPIALAWLAYNHHFYGEPVHLGQALRGTELAQLRTGSTDMWQTPLWLGAAGLLVSPSRGLLIFSPVVIFAFWGLVRLWQKPEWRWLRAYSLALPVLWGIAFKWFDWWGGWTFGYRPIVDTMPLLALFMVPVFAEVLERTWRLRLFAVTAAWSIAVQFIGAFAYDLAEWHYLGAHDIDKPEYRDRLWSVSDNQLLFSLTHWSQNRASRAQHADMWRRDPNM